MVKKKGKTIVTVYSAWCKGCGICVAFCPGKVLEFDEHGKAYPAHMEECINCGFCELHCPDFAISVRPKKDEKCIDEMVKNKDLKK
ncbi:2-oxoglutarate ferredoxin oxidoreductase subunit delta [Desulfonauticus submarinus]|uniref:2-oxoglutarate ferredoxin oxidoreductase subunit delta n=1 Tax=Desulfonauticus submarinus TaxID=206665 RepID=A0A1G9ZWR8_9BACT|nr:4Fe-4S dicluster domain-containing protein [Desulfonauticus submarinus]SDN25770.1 2-oxoglutarate ferredoxin oxidoreductase subunit delta [Desulfonauticus submarinus]